MKIKSILAAGAAALLLAACQPTDDPYKDTYAMAESSVFISIAVPGKPGKGHCTGTHLGYGYVLTAAHCAITGGVFEIDESGRQAEVLWSNKSYDVAMMYDPLISSQIPASSITCKPPYIGQEIFVRSNPLDLRDMMTYGRIASMPRQLAIWKRVAVHNIAGAPGSSGSGVFDMKGRIVGVLVGGHSPFTNVSIVVPSSEICRLMGDGIVATPE